MKKVLSAVLVVSLMSIIGCQRKDTNENTILGTRLVGTAEGCKIYYIDSISGYLAKCEGSSSMKTPVGKSQAHVMVEEEEK